MSKPLNAIILFADLVSSSRLSDVLNIYEYNKILVYFQNKGHDILVELSKKLELHGDIIDTIDGAINGEEIRIVVVLKDIEQSKKDPQQSRIVNTHLKLITLAVFQAALDLSLNWYLSTSINQEKIENIASPSRIGIGLHYGKVEMTGIYKGKWEDCNWIKDIKPTYIPLSSSINFGKRVEAASRLSQGIAISISQSFYALCIENGVPIIVGEKLHAEPKGFEYPQPVYDLKNQYALLTNSKLSKEPSEKIDLLKDALYYDPNRVVIFYAMVIENFINRASLNDDNDDEKEKDYNSAVQYATYPLGIVENPAYFHWLLAISTYRRSSLKKDDNSMRSDINLSILHYKQAANQLSWAALDLAYAYLRRAYLPDSGPENRKKDLQTSYQLLSKLIEKDPLLFHAYNVRALVISEINTNEYNKDNPSIEQASADLAKAKLLNDVPEYLYFGTEAKVEFAKAKVDNELAKAKVGLANSSHIQPNHRRETINNLVANAKGKLNLAIEDNKRYQAGHNGEIPNYHFWRPGFTDPPYHPPRPASLIDSWDKLLKELNKV